MEPLPPVEQTTFSPLELHKISVKTKPGTPDKHDTTLAKDEYDPPLERITPKNVHHLERKLMSLPELTPDKITLLQKQDPFCNKIPAHLHCNAYDKYFTDSMGIFAKKVIDFNSTFSSVVLPKILIKYLLHASHDSLGHVVAMKLYHYIKRL